MLSWEGNSGGALEHGPRNQRGLSEFPDNGEVTGVYGRTVGSKEE